MIKRYLFLCVAMLAVLPVLAQEKTLNTDPEKVNIVSSDIDLFWKAYDKAKPENSLYVFRDDYISKREPRPERIYRVPHRFFVRTR